MKAAPISSLIIVPLLIISSLRAESTIKSIDINPTNGNVLVCRHTIHDTQKKVIETQIELYPTTEDIKQKKFKLWIPKSELNPGGINLTGTRAVINDTRFIDDSIVARYSRKQAQYSIDEGAFKTIRPFLPRFNPYKAESHYKRAVSSTSDMNGTILFTSNKKNLLFNGINKDYIVAIGFNPDATLLAVGFKNGIVEIHAVKDLEKTIAENRAISQKIVKLEYEIYKISETLFRNAMHEMKEKETLDLVGRLRIAETELYAYKQAVKIEPLYFFDTNAPDTKISVSAIKFGLNNRLIIGKENGQIKIRQLEKSIIQTRAEQRINYLSDFTFIREKMMTQAAEIKTLKNKLAEEQMLENESKIDEQKRQEPVYQRTIEQQVNKQKLIEPENNNPQNSSFFSSVGRWLSNNKTLLIAGTSIVLCCAITMVLKYKFLLEKLL